jgi:hypothetical protein
MYKMGELVDPFVAKIFVMMDELSNSHGPSENYRRDEIYIFALWLIALGFSTAKPHPSKKESRAISDAFSQVFRPMASDIFDGDPDSSDFNIFCHNFVNESLSLTRERSHKYNDAFNRDKALGLATLDDESSDFVSENLIKMFVAFVFSEVEINDMSQLDERFILGFMECFIDLSSETLSHFQRFTL